MAFWVFYGKIVALRNEKGSYSLTRPEMVGGKIVALRNEKGSYSSLAHAM